MVNFATLFVATLVGLASAAPMPTSDCGSSGCGSSSQSSSESSSSGCGSSGCDSGMKMGSASSSMMSEPPMMMSEPPMMTTSTMMAESTTTSTAMAMATTAASSYSPPMYGSGSSSYGSSSSGSSSYDSCVQQCVAQFGAPSSMSMPPSSSSSYGSSSSYDSSSSSNSSSSSGSSGSGTTHTVIVAPTQGVLRYVPFAVNASVGDTVKFMWMASPHTVTKSSQLELCNKTTDAPFTSGVQNASFVFEQVVNNTDPTFYYCGVPGHCQKGMFGIINPPNAFVAPTSVGNMMPAIAANSSGTAAAMSANLAITGPAATWGASIDLAKMPDWAMAPMADNVLFTRSFMAANAEAIGEDGQLDMSRIASGSMMVPPDVAAASTAAPATADGSSGSAAASPAASASGSGAAAPSSTAAGGSLSKSGAGAITTPRALVAVAAVAAAFFAL